MCIAMFLALSLSLGNSLVSSWRDHSMLASLKCRYGQCKLEGLTNYCIGLPLSASISPTDIANHLLPYNLTSFDVRLCSVWLQCRSLCAKIAINYGLGLEFVGQLGRVMVMVMVRVDIRVSRRIVWARWLIG